MKFKGRPRNGPIQLKDGFYIEVCNPGMKGGVKIWCASENAMEEGVRLNSKHKNVIMLGEYKGGRPVSKMTAK